MSEEPLNYFNYFTETEEHFQRARGTSLFLLSPLDWALIESWKNADVPLEAVLRGIDAAFDKWRTKRVRSQMVNSLAFCSQAVMTEAQRMADGQTSKPRREESAPFPAEELRKYLAGNAAKLRETGIPEMVGLSDTLQQLSEDVPDDLESLEQRLSAMEQKMIAIARTRESEESALEARKELNAYIRPYRGKMSAPQIAMLEAQFLERSALERMGLPRLSLFYLR
ncbi:MAG: hypothetical protein KGN84_18565 [Acidobacteriota bacterium]|nr:hypothetical protein [Acidobacteriota bacterium]